MFAEYTLIGRDPGDKTVIFRNLASLTTFTDYKPSCGSLGSNCLRLAAAWRLHDLGFVSLDKILYASVG